MEEPGPSLLLSPVRRERPRLGPAGPRSRRQTRPSNASAASAGGARDDEHARETSYGSNGSNFSDEPESIISGPSYTETTVTQVSTPVTAVIPETILEDTGATTDSESSLAPSIVSSTAHGHSSDSARLSTVSTGILYSPYSNAEPDFNHDMQSPPAYSATDFGSRIHTPDPSTTAFSSPSQPVVHLDEDVTIRVPLQSSPNPSQLHTRDLPLSPPARLPSSSPTPIATAPPVSSLSIAPPFNARDSFHPPPSPSPLLTTSFPHQQRHSTSSSPRSSSPLPSTPSRNSPLPSRPSTSLSVYGHPPPSTASIKSVNSNSNSTPKSAPIPLPPLPPLIPIEFPDPPLNLSAIGDEDYARYKPLTLEAAQWTLSSGELQALVSAAIRESADVRFIRLLKPSVATDLLSELDRLDSERRILQAKHRFEEGRKKMYLQSLYALACSSSSSSSLPDDAQPERGGPSPSAASIQHSHSLASLTTSLSNSLSIQADLISELLIATHLHTQLSALHAHHLTSALAVALRKLNTSYGKRTKELERERRERREERDGWKVIREGWEEEREEGWKIAVEVGGRLDGERESWEVERDAWRIEREGWVGKQESWEREREIWRKEREKLERQRGSWEMERREWEDEKGWWVGERKKWEVERRELLEKMEAAGILDSASADPTAVVETSPVESPPPIHLDASIQTEPLVTAPTPDLYLDSLPHTNPLLDPQAQLQRSDSGSWESTIDGHSFHDNASINTQDHQVVGVMGTAVASKARLTMIPSPRLGDFAEQQRQGEDDKPPPVPSKSPTAPPSSYPSTIPNTSTPLPEQESSPVDQKTPTAKHDRRLSGSSQVSQVSLVSAARKRSMRASKASLRIPARVTAKVNARSPTSTNGANPILGGTPTTDSPTLGAGLSPILGEIGATAAGISGSPIVQSSLWSTGSGSDIKEGGEGDEVKSVRSRRARSRSRSRSRADISTRVPSVHGKGKGHAHGRGRSRGGSLGGISATDMPPLPGASVNGEGVGVGGGKERERVVSVDGVSMKGKGKRRDIDGDVDGNDDGEGDDDDTYMSFLELGGRALELESELGKGGAEREVSAPRPFSATLPTRSRSPTRNLLAAFASPTIFTTSSRSRHRRPSTADSPTNTTQAQAGNAAGYSASGNQSYGYPRQQTASASALSLTFSANPMAMSSATIDVDAVAAPVDAHVNLDEDSVVPATTTLPTAEDDHVNGNGIGGSKTRTRRQRYGYGGGRIRAESRSDSFVIPPLGVGLEAMGIAPVSSRPSTSTQSSTASPATSASASAGTGIIFAEGGSGGLGGGMRRAMSPVALGKRKISMSRGVAPAMDRRGRSLDFHVGGFGLGRGRSGSGSGSAAGSSDQSKEKVEKEKGGEGVLKRSMSDMWKGFGGLGMGIGGGIGKRRKSAPMVSMSAAEEGAEEESAEPAEVALSQPSHEPAIIEGVPVDKEGNMHVEEGVINIEAPSAQNGGESDTGGGVSDSGAAEGP